MRYFAILAWLALVLGLAAADAEKKPMDIFKECDACPEMVVVPAGRFTMGSPVSEPDRTPDEDRQHLVTFVRPFAVGKFAVTVSTTIIAKAGQAERAKLQRGRAMRRRRMLSWVPPGGALRLEIHCCVSEKFSPTWPPSPPRQSCRVDRH